MNIGIIGAGKIVEDSHLPVLTNLKGVNLSWIFDVNTERVQEIGNAYGVNTVNKVSLQEAIGTIDHCLVAIPYGVRNEYYDYLSNQNIKLYVEKPLAFSSQELEQLQQGFGAGVTAGFQRRYYQSVNYLRSIVRKGVFGALKGVQYIQGFYDLRSGGKGKFHTSAAMAGGGVIAESAIHGLDVLIYILEPERIALSSIQSLSDEGLDYHNDFQSEFLMAGRRLPVHCEISRLKALGNYFTFNFEHATVIMHFKPDAYLLVKRDGLAFHIDEILTKEKYATSIDEAFYLCWHDFFYPPAAISENDNGKALQLLTNWLEQIYAGINP